MKLNVFSLVLLFFVFSGNFLVAQPIIIDHNCAKLDPIPADAIQTAKSNLHIAYGHTSHGSQLTTGMTGLVGQTGLLGYKGDIYSWNNGGSGNALDIHDKFVGGDLGHKGDLKWEADTRTYLAANSDVNVIIWSWCGGASDNTVAGMNIYLNAMNQLELDFPTVKFVYMTGHLDGSGESGNLHAMNEQIRDFCTANNKILYDFADIESYDPDGNYYHDKLANDGCYYDSDNSGSRDANWAINWQNSHTKGVDWYECTSAHSQPLNANLKAYAAWWLWCRLAGWSGTSEPTAGDLSFGSTAYTCYENDASINITVNRVSGTKGEVSVNYDVSGGTATINSDYQFTAGVFTWADGNSDAKTITIPILQDTEEEGAETIMLELAGATGGAGIVTSATTITIADDDGDIAIDVRVNKGSDDAEEIVSNGNVDISSSDLELTEDRGGAQIIGIRFANLNIPQAANISNAYVQFTCDEATDGTTDLSIYGNDIDSASTFSASNLDISTRIKTTSNVGWQPPAWDQVGENGPDQRTPDISAIIQTIINKDGWKPGNALALLITGTGNRVAESYSGAPNAAPLLHIEYNTETASIPHISMNDILIHPNPSNGVFNIDVEKFDTNSNVLIYSSMGCLVYSGKLNRTVDISSQPAGVYFIQINANSQIYKSKFLKE
ncbi:MAG: hypothetical protein B6I20_07055 [Bacteroidetes bacterium 4572_117]|nr:MAG: hypothetical protein B6I20_07055 [Bacteroidetes bacterium 4572_117]